MLAPLLLLLAQTATPPTVADEIVVVGHRAEDALVACLARQCPPAEDVEASLQASVEQFAGGRYDRARRTLQAAIRRNRDHAAQLPGPVSSLYATLATVAEHEGDTDLWRDAARNNMLVLRRHLGSDDRVTLTEQLSFGDTMLGLRQPVTADGAYATVQRLAIAAKYDDIAASATFRRAWLALARDQFDRSERFMDEAVRLAGPNNRDMAELRDVVRTRIAVRKGDEGAVDQLAARLARSPVERPRLIFSRPVRDVNPPQDFVHKDAWHDAEIHFADVGYWIRPDGRTADGEVLRNSGLGQWTSAILQQVSERRYVALSAAYPGLYRIDRFTVRATIGVPTGSRIRQRMGNLTVHIVDLTETEALSDVHKRRVADAAITATP